MMQTKNNSNQIKPKSRNYFLYFTATIAGMMMMIAGISFTWTSPVLPKLHTRIDRKLTVAEKSWITGLMHLGGVLGSLVAGRVADTIGRKKSLLVVSCPMVVSFLMAAFAKTIPLLYVARLLMGIGAGSTFTILPLYLSEIAENHNRGTVSTFRAIFGVAGVLFSFLFGPFLTIKNFCLICVIPSLISVIIFWMWMPETPHYLAYQNDQKRLRKSLARLRMKSKEDVEEELISIPKGIRKKGNIKDLLDTKATRKGLWLTIGLIMWQQSAGIAAVDCNLQTIFEESGSRLSPESSSIIVASVRLVCIFFTTLIVDRIDRRTLLLISSCGASGSLFSLGIYFHLKSSSFDVESIFWVPLLSLAIHSISYSLGMLVLPLTIAAEIFPITVRAKAVSMLVIALGNNQTFCILGFVSFTLGVILFLTLPETRGKSLQEIQDLLEQ